MAGDVEFGDICQEISVWRQNDRVGAWQSVGLLNRCAQRANAVSGGSLANAIARISIRHIKGIVNRKDRRRAEAERKTPRSVIPIAMSQRLVFLYCAKE